MRRTMLTFRALRIACATALCGALLAGCQAKLMPTPVVFAGTGIDPVAEAHAGERTTMSRVFYATDRTPRKDPQTPAFFYTNKRDYGLRLGVASVDLAPGMTWEQLHEASLQGKRRENPAPRLTSIDELGPLWLEIPRSRPVPSRIRRWRRDSPPECRPRSMSQRWTRSSSSSTASTPASMTTS